MVSTLEGLIVLLKRLKYKENLDVRQYMIYWRLQESVSESQKKQKDQGTLDRCSSGREGVFLSETAYLEALVEKYKF